jgi:hypothetical protein
MLRRGDRRIKPSQLNNDGMAGNKVTPVHGGLWHHLPMPRNTKSRLGAWRLFFLCPSLVELLHRFHHFRMRNWLRLSRPSSGSLRNLLSKPLPRVLHFLLVAFSVAWSWWWFARLSVDLCPPVQAQRIAQNVPFLRGAELSDAAVDQAIMQMYRKDVIGVQAIGHVLKAYEEPPHDWGSKTAWRLANLLPVSVGVHGRPWFLEPPPWQDSTAGIGLKR